MMKKVLLIEDRAVRQQFFINETNINLDDFSDILDNFTNESYDELELQIENNSFNFEKYDYIISHKSAFAEKNSELLSRLKDFCKLKKTPLILFSGGISTNYYESNEYEILELNSKTFYSKNLELFLKALENDNENILMLCYGKHWKQNIISNMLEKVNIYLDANDKEQVTYSKFSSAISIDNLESFQYNFYNIDKKNIRINISEIIKFRDSLYAYFDAINMDYSKRASDNQKTILIHDNNIVDLQQFKNRIKFTPNVSEIDEYISNNIIVELKNKEFDVIYIKDKLSSNYLELYGLRVAYHIRLSEELENKKYFPIVILSDFSVDILNRLEPMANILLTKNIFLIANTKEAIEKTKNVNFDNLTLDEYQEDFLDKIKVQQPKDYLTHHSIANEWSMYRWAEYLDVNTPDIMKIKDDISSMLYFKYLQAKFPIRRNSFSKRKQSIQGKGKILYIDDEWKKGWKSIFENLSQESHEYTLETVEEEYIDKSQEDIIEFIMHKVVRANPDVIILDMRLHEDDFLEGVALADFTGIQVFNKIKEINPGIQVIIFTASNNSLLLDELHSYNDSILGYVKKEHPENYNLTTQGNINKLINFINKGLEEKYLKDIYTTKKAILAVLKNDIFNQYIQNMEKYEKFWIKLEVEAKSIFDILAGNSDNKFIYAMISIASSLETILSIFVVENRNDDDEFWDGEKFECPYKSLNCKLNELFYSKLGYPKNNNAGFPNKNLDMQNLIAKRNDYLHSRAPVSINSDQIVSYYKKLLKMIQTIQSPPKLKK